MGLTPQADEAFVLAREFRLRWHDGYERVRLGRESRDSELVVWVEVLTLSPRR